MAETIVADPGAGEKLPTLVSPVVGEETEVGRFFSTTLDKTLSLKRSALIIEMMLNTNNQSTIRNPALTINKANSLNYSPPWFLATTRKTNSVRPALITVSAAIAWSFTSLPATVVPLVEPKSSTLALEPSQLIAK